MCFGFMYSGIVSGHGFYEFLVNIAKSDSHYKIGIRLKLLKTLPPSPDSGAGAREGIKSKKR
jgi:hypothetical protein